jgi:DNA polymerase I-like protein with 3'-5' exonuclease and polymerase domains
MGNSQAASKQQENIMCFAALDAETSMKPTLMPYQEGAYLSTIGISLDNGEHYDWVFNHDEVESPDTQKNIKEMKDVLSRITLLFGHNIKFDCLWLLALRFNLWDDLPPVWDTMVVDYLLEGQRPLSRMISLAELSDKWGIPPKKDKVKMYWDSGVDTAQIPIKVLLPYQKQDCLNALSIGKYQHELMLKNGWGSKVIKIHNEMVKELAVIEYNGMACDQDQMVEFIDEYENKLDFVYHKLKEVASKHEGTNCEHINFNAPSDLSAFLFGGTVKYDTTEVVVYTKKHYLKVEKKDEDGNVIHYKSGKRKGEPVLQNHPVDLICTRTRKAVKEVVLKGCGFTPPKWAVNKETGAISSDKNVLPELKKRASFRHKRIITWVEERSNVKKVLETFKGAKGDKGLITKIMMDSLIHPKYNQTIAKTGRLSSSDPNGQNFPRSGTSPLKKVFVSRYKDGYILVADLAQLEWRVAAWLSQDPVAMQEIIDNVDYHGQNAIELFGDIKYRQDAKILGFRLLYGGSAYAFYMDPKMPNKSLKEWEDIVERYYQKYNRLAQWQNEIFHYVNGHTETEKQTNKEGVIKEIIWGYYFSATGRKYKFRKQPIKKNHWAMGFKDTQVKNFQVQGTATGDIMPLAMCVIGRRLREAQANGRLKSALPIGQVHDSVLFDVRKEDVRELAELCIGTYEDLPGIIGKFFNLDWNVPLTGDATVGKDYGTTEYTFERPTIGAATVIKPKKAKCEKPGAWEVHWSKVPVGGWMGNVYSEKELANANVGCRA